MRHTHLTRAARLAALFLVCSSTAWAQRVVSGNTVSSGTLPKVVLHLDPTLTYLGTQSFVLYNVANAQQFFFAELDGKRVKRYVWIQFEGYLPDKPHTYNYSSDSITTIWGRTIYRNSVLRQIPPPSRILPPTARTRGSSCGTAVSPWRPRCCITAWSGCRRHRRDTS